ncbi:hypothetical protein N7462_008153 [Penicillium macrosclerotiorum]|uniref:uncharacterized protein n=1 Tax=Penicillium macrosclerotiorum TaxID=303699 RepID=UPI0025468304|nr:uncharacterized protein N7462_008153 [Penicillium macrosclerotiorum]KAJ5679909.1 hypothetical protein N7462_008153 [Penicillium macrosclerotiorum]
MPGASSIKIYPIPVGLQSNENYSIKVRSRGDSLDQPWYQVPVYPVEVSNASTNSDTFNHYYVGMASFDFNGPIQIRVTYNQGPVHSAVIRPISRGILSQLYENTVNFSFDRAQDVMLELNGNKWQVLHIITNEIDDNPPDQTAENVWYFESGLNQGAAAQYATDGVNLMVPSDTTVYLAGGSFINYRLNFTDVCNSCVRGHGFILGPEGGFVYRELGGAIHMSRASNIRVEGITSLGAKGFSLSAGECNNVHVNRYRSFTSAGNGDGIDFFCSSDILIENCFLRNSDDNIALYSHRWDWYGDSRNITIQNCVLLPDIAHAINMGTHGNPDNPETTSNIKVRNIDILDHEENQIWYQGCLAVTAADSNTFHNIDFEDIRVERITRGQLLNVRVMHNIMWSRAPGKLIHNITFKNVSLNTKDSKVVNPSMVMGYDETRKIDGITFDNLRIGDKIIHDGMIKPKWYMVSDFVPLFANEHVKALKFIQTSECNEAISPYRC